MTAFTEEQQKILGAMFDHLWARMASLHDDVNEDSVRLGALIDVLHTKGTITREQVHKIMHVLSMEASEKRHPAKPTDRTEPQITRQILHGDLVAFTRVCEEEDREGRP